jgi:hypothetical protein
MNLIVQILSPEEKLLISLCRLQFTEEQKGAVCEYMKQVTDWSYFVKMANEHGIIALCWNSITETGNSSFIPSDFLTKLYSGYLVSLSRNTQLFDLLENVFLLAREENTKVVLLKGLALEKLVYGNKGLRQMNDIDILVKHDSAINLRKKLLKHGFESIPIISPLHERKMPFYGKHLPEMYKKGLSVEIHFKLFDQRGNSLTEKLFDEAVLTPAIPDDSGIYIPEPQMFFLYLVKHLDKHEKAGVSQLRLYTDMVAMLSLFSREIINERLFMHAETVGTQDAVNEKLYLLNFFWNIRFPVWIEDLFREIDKTKILDRFLYFLREPKNKPEEIPESILKPLSDINGVFNKTLFIVGCLAPSLTYMKFKYKLKSNVGAAFYYPVRWAKFVKSLFSGKL